jgi:hypothetical protein
MEQFSTKSITSTSSTLYTVNATYKPLHPDALPEEGTLDLTISNGISAWSQKDIIDQDLAHMIPNRMKHALEALTDFLEPKEDYIFKIQENTTTTNGSSLDLNVEWNNARHGKDAVYRLHIKLLENDEDDVGDSSGGRKTAPFDVLIEALKELNAVTNKCEKIQEECKKLGEIVGKQVAKLDMYAEDKQCRDESVVIKTAALLSSKDKKIKQLQQQGGGSIDR